MTKVPKHCKRFMELKAIKGDMNLYLQCKKCGEVLILNSNNELTNVGYDY